MSDVTPEGAEEISEPIGNSEALAGEAAAAETAATESASEKSGTAEKGSSPAPTGATRTAAPKPAPAPAAGEDSRANRRKVREGLVISVKMDKTAVIGVNERVRHPRYAKTVQRTKRLYAHNTDEQLKPGDRVRLAETRPLSKLKRWRIVEVLERAK